MRLVTFVTISLLTFNCFAQNHIDNNTQDLIVIDTAKVICSYEYKHTNDTLKADAIQDDLLYLQIGDKHSKCYSYYTFRYDSLCSTPQGFMELQQMIVKLNRLLAKENDFPPHIDHPFFRLTTRIYKNYPEGKMTVSDFILDNYYIYEDDLDAQEWALAEDSAKIILGYECQKATCRFRGREWTAWYAIDIPISDGPWKFMGLPGLIMEVYDKEKQQYYCINGMQKANSEPIYFGSIGIDAKRFEKTTFQTFLKASYRNLRGEDNHLAEQIGLPSSEKKTYPEI